MNEEITLWRLHIKPAHKSGSRKDVIDYCIDNDIAGIGWPLKHRPASLDDYTARVGKYHNSKKPASINFAEDIQVNDLIWTRDEKGTYHLGRITGSWFYDNNPDILKLDIPNQRKCEWVMVGTEDKVPGHVVACFRATRTLQRVLNGKKEGVALSKWLFNQKVEQQNKEYEKYENPLANLHKSLESAEKFFAIIGSDDCEDIVGLYLQLEKGYTFIPSSCKKNTAGHEFILINKKNNNLIAAQVKQGDVEINTDLLNQDFDEYYLLSTKGSINKNHEPRKNQTRFIELSKEDLFNFVDKNIEIMPAKISHWLGILKAIEGND